MIETIVWGYTVITDKPINKYIQTRIKDSLFIGYKYGTVKTKKEWIDWKVKQK